MSNYIATVVKTGNSYALRVPKQYIEAARLKLGQKATIGLPLPDKKQDRNKVQDIIRQLQQTEIYKDIKDPAAWQRAVRKDRPLPGRR